MVRVWMWVYMCVCMQLCTYEYGCRTPAHVHTRTSPDRTLAIAYKLHSSIVLQRVEVCVNVGCLRVHECTCVCMHPVVGPPFCLVLLTLDSQYGQDSNHTRSSVGGGNGVGPATSDHLLLWERRWVCVTCPDAWCLCVSVLPSSVLS